MTSITSREVITSDQEQFTLEWNVLRHCRTLLEIPNDTTVEILTLALVDSYNLGIVIRFCQLCPERPRSSSAYPIERHLLQEWETEFIYYSDSATLQLIMATEYLGLQPLLDLLCNEMHLRLRGLTPDEVRARFEITNDLTPVERAEIIKLNEWCG